MTVNTATELAYKNGYERGYEAGKRDAVVHGRWVDEYKGQFANKKYICSVCGNRANSDDWKWVLSPYCPNCGADMRGEGNG